MTRSHEKIHTPIEPPETERTRRPRLLAASAFAAATLAAVGFAFFTAPAATSCPGGFPPQTLAPFVGEGLAALQLHDAPRKAPDLRFLAASGQEETLAAFQGKILLVNFWATWCAPCREETPALNRLKEKMPNRDFDVVAINMDVNPGADPRGFLKSVDANALAFYADPGLNNFKRLKKDGKVFGLPTTFLIDRQGCETAVLNGPAVWDSPEAVALLERMTSLVSSASPPSEGEPP